MSNLVTLYQGDSLDILRTLPEAFVNCCITSPPYYNLRDYGAEGQIGLEATPQIFIERLVTLFREVRRVLKDDGVLWLNIGDTYCTTGKGSKQPPQTLHKSGLQRYPARSPQAEALREWGVKGKDLLGIPWRLAFALQADGWYLRSDCIWNKTNCLPESVTDRPTKAHEYLFLLTKSAHYHYDADAIREPIKAATVSRYRSATSGKGAKPCDDPRVSRMGRSMDRPGRKEVSIERGRNRRTVWNCAVSSYRGAHFATYPPRLIEPCVLAGCPPEGVVLDPFCGSGTTGEVALKHGRRFVGIELNEEYLTLARERLGVE